MVNLSTAVVAPADCTAAQLEAAVYAWEPATQPTYHPADVALWARETVRIAALAGVRPSVMGGQTLVETRGLRFGGDVSPAQYNFAGIGATGGGVPGEAWDGIAAGVLGQGLHWCGYVYGAVEQWRERAPALAGAAHLARRQRQIMASGFGGRVKVIGDLGNGVWAADPRYAEKLVRAANIILQQEGTLSVETRFLKALGAAGVARDMRGKLPTNAGHPYSNRPNGLASIKQIGVHWTGDRFNDATLRAITGTAFATGGAISPAMSEADEIDLLKWYAHYHIGKDGGTWGGIAYTIVVFPSGRLYLCHDFATLTYHAFNANVSALAICGPNSQGAAPTSAQLRTMFAAIDWLCHETPEVPAGRGDVWGHQQLAFVDSRNAGTVCPGTFLPAVNVYRSSRTIPGGGAAPVPGPEPSPEQAYEAGQRYRHELLTVAAGEIPYRYRGPLRKEGWLDLRGVEPAAAQDERWMDFEKITLHTLAGRVEAFAREGDYTPAALRERGKMGDF